MPEGPEVRRMAQDLASDLSGKSLEAIEVVSGRYTKSSIAGITEINDEMPMKIIGVGCHGKFLYMLTASGHNIWSTLGMTGQWSKLKTRHTRIELKILDSKSIYFNDIRNFGTLKIVYGKSLLLKKLKALGPDILAADIDEDFFVQRVRSKNNKQITSVLMNQKIFAGIGNYIKSESLWLAEISPLLRVDQITDKKLKKLCKSIKNIARESYNTGGATFRTHKNFSDNENDESYGHRFLCYGRKIDAEGHVVQKIKTEDGRTTHWSPTKQGKDK